MLSRLPDPERPRICSSCSFGTVTTRSLAAYEKRATRQGTDFTRPCKTNPNEELGGTNDLQSDRDSKKEQQPKKETKKKEAKCRHDDAAEDDDDDHDDERGNARSTISKLAWGREARSPFLAAVSAGEAAAARAPLAPTRSAALWRHLPHLNPRSTTGTTPQTPRTGRTSPRARERELIIRNARFPPRFLTAFLFAALAACVFFFCFDGLLLFGWLP